MAKTDAASARAGRTRTTRATGASKRAPARPAGARKKPKLPRAVLRAADAARDKKAENVVVLDLHKASGFTDYFVICTGNNARQIGAIADAVTETLRKDLGERPALQEGLDKSEWVLLDYFNFVVHIFSRECRSFYDLERLWGNADRYEIGEPEPLPASD
jgi:ribosome-associated protein